MLNSLLFLMLNGLRIKVFYFKTEPVNHMMAFFIFVLFGVPRLKREKRTLRPKTLIYKESHKY